MLLDQLHLLRVYDALNHLQLLELLIKVARVILSLQLWLVRWYDALLQQFLHINGREPRMRHYLIDIPSSAQSQVLVLIEQLGDQVLRFE